MDRVISVFASAAALVGAGMVVVAQGVLDPTADNMERFIGGTFILVAGTVGFRWAYQLLKAVREDNTELRTQLTSMTTKYEKQLTSMTTKYEKERDLRMSLEESGLADRRHREPPEGTPSGF